MHHSVRQVGLNSLRTIEIEVEKHVEELLGLFAAEDKGGKGDNLQRLKAVYRCGAPVVSDGIVEKVCTTRTLVDGVLESIQSPAHQLCRGSPKFCNVVLVPQVVLS